VSITKTEKEQFSTNTQVHLLKMASHRIIAFLQETEVIVEEFYAFTADLLPPTRGVDLSEQESMFCQRFSDALDDVLKGILIAVQNLKKLQTQHDVRPATEDPPPHQTEEAEEAGGSDDQDTNWPAAANIRSLHSYFLALQRFVLLSLVIFKMNISIVL